MRGRRSSRPRPSCRSGSSATRDSRGGHSLESTPDPMPLQRTLLLALSALSAVSALSACDRFGSRAKTAFVGDSALSYTRQQVAFGPRVPGTPQAQRAGDWIVRMMKARADTVIEQRGTPTTADGKQLPLRNILARFRPQATQRVLYLTHWDTRPIADQDPILGNRGDPIPG